MEALSKNRAKVEWLKQERVVGQVKCQGQRRETGDRLGIRRDCLCGWRKGLEVKEEGKDGAL